MRTYVVVCLLVLMAVLGLVTAYAASGPGYELNWLGYGGSASSGGGYTLTGWIIW